MFCTLAAWDSSLGGDSTRLVVLAGETWFRPAQADFREDDAVQLRQQQHETGLQGLQDLAFRLLAARWPICIVNMLSVKLKQLLWGWTPCVAEPLLEGGPRAGADDVCCEVW